MCNKIKNLRLVIFLAVFTLLAIMGAGCAKNYSSPPVSVDASDIDGIWKAGYTSERTDTLTIDLDGNFVQIYEDARTKYVFNSGSHGWILEQDPSGVVYLHLQGGRYYLEGLSIGEDRGRKSPSDPCLDGDCTWGLEPRLYYDPFADRIVTMVDELLLVVLVDSTGEIVLHHVWISSDQGFSLFEGNKQVFYRIGEVLP